MRFIVLPMLEAFGETQKNILLALREKKAGLTADQLAERFSITRTAIRQHMLALEQLGYTEQDALNHTGGRPAILYKLSEKGWELFPKQYAWFSEIILQSLKTKGGPENLADFMREMGTAVANTLLSQLENKSQRERLEAIVSVMNSLAYEANVIAMKDSSLGRGIDASNCVYHALASRFPEVCEFDLALLEVLTGKDVEQKSCMVRGGQSCRFAFRKKISGGG